MYQHIRLNFVKYLDICCVLSQIKWHCTGFKLGSNATGSVGTLIVQRFSVSFNDTIKRDLQQIIVWATEQPMHPTAASYSKKGYEAAVMLPRILKTMQHSPEIDVTWMQSRLSPVGADVVVNVGQLWNGRKRCRRCSQCIISVAATDGKKIDVHRYQKTDGLQKSNWKGTSSSEATERLVFRCGVRKIHQRLSELDKDNETCMKSD